MSRISSPNTQLYNYIKDPSLVRNIKVGLPITKVWEQRNQTGY